MPNTANTISNTTSSNMLALTSSSTNSKTTTTTTKGIIMPVARRKTTNRTMLAKLTFKTRAKHNSRMLCQVKTRSEMKCSRVQVAHRSSKIQRSHQKHLDRRMEQISSNSTDLIYSSL